jgi:hypothetical protein
LSGTTIAGFWQIVPPNDLIFGKHGQTIETSFTIDNCGRGDVAMY